jgi:hypothetical protein
MNEVIEPKHLLIIFRHDRTPFLPLPHRPRPKTLKAAKMKQKKCFKKTVEPTRRNRYCPRIFLFLFSLPSLRPFYHTFNQ